MYHAKVHYPFIFQCHNCWGTEHLTSQYLVCPKEYYDEKYRMVLSDPEAK